MKLKVILILIFNFILLVSSQDSQCVSYINSQSTYTQDNCGSSLDTACLTFSEAVKSCNIQQFNTTVYNFSPGTYSFKGVDPFGTIKNKNITILNSNYSVVTDTSYTSVVFDLGGASNTFFNLDFDIDNIKGSNIYVIGITFINGNQNGQASIADNQGTSSILNFQQCVFENIKNNGDGNSITVGGAFSWIPNSKANDTLVSTVTFTQCTVQNTDTTGMDGAFFYASNLANIYLTFRECSFANLSGTGQGSIVYAPIKAPLQGSVVISFFNSNITNNQFGGSAVYTSNTLSVHKSQFSNNSGGGFGFYIFGMNVYQITESQFTNNTNIASFYANSIPTGLSFSNCVFSQNNYNIASNYSGAVTLSSAAASFYIVLFEDNVANNGAAIYASGTMIGQQISLINTTFNNNHAVNNGSIYLSNTFIQVGSNTVFTNNVAELGSSIFCSGSEMTFLNGSTVTFSNNNDTTTNKQSIENDTNGVTCGPNGTSTCSVKGNLNDLKICSANSNDSDDKKGLGNGMKALIAIAIGVGVILLIVIIIVLIRRAKEKSRYKPIGY